MSNVSPKPVVVTMPARPILPSMSALVMSVVACTIGAVMSAGRTPALAEQLAHAGAHAVERSRRRGQRLVDDDPAGRRVEQHDVGERAADVDGEAPVSGHLSGRQRSSAGRCRCAVARTRRGSTPRRTRRRR